MAEHLLLKWGTLKGWTIEGEAAMAALRRYGEGGVSMSSAMQHDSDDQKKALCELIDLVDGPITNDWSGERMTREEAKAYVMEYGRDRK